MYDTIQKEPVEIFPCPFTDCFDQSVIKAYSLGIVNGKSETEFCPSDLITRQELSKVLVNMLEIAGKDVHISTEEFESIKEMELSALITDGETDDPEAFTLEGDKLDLEETLETLLILDMETKFLCDPECKGLCSKCGANLNLGPCGCGKEIDPRLAVLEQLLDK